MREELLRVLNSKLDNINSDIASLTELNRKIDEENEKLDFINRIIDLFKENGENNPLNFDKIEKDDFTRVLSLVDEDVSSLFNSSACNYDGLVYLIKGIRDGVSISLTNEQTNGIDYLIQALTDKKNEDELQIKSYEDEKSKYEISDLNELEIKKSKYEDTLSNVVNNEYIRDVDLLKEAIAFASLTAEDTIGVLSYVLEYNSNLYQENKPVSHVEVKEENKFEEKFEEKEPEENEEVKEEFNDTVFHFNQLGNTDLFELPNITFDDENESDKESSEENTNEPITFESNDVSNSDNYNSLNDIQYVPFGENDTLPEFNSFDDMPKAVPLDETDEEPDDSGESIVDVPFSLEENNETSEEEIPAINNEYGEPAEEESDEIEKEEKEKTSTRELHKIFGKYGIEENVILNELIDGDLEEYQKILDTLKENNILDCFKENKELLIETLLYSSAEVIDKVLRIIKEDLSFDDEDYDVTLKIVINTIPSIFISEGGNYNNFINNVELFKRLEINLINLFDFSKEVFIADNESIENNLAIVNKYDFDINCRNAKYFLLIPNIEDKLDYYIESFYDVKITDDKGNVKTETFDGVNYIKDFTAKLNVVTDMTIKRLRYAVENGKKVFGSKPGSLSGEITNLKINAMDLNSSYLNKFFNNEFKDITEDEVREYVKLVRNSSNVGDYSDELDKLKLYHDGLRYNIEGIKVSYNKVLRNYNILRSYGIDIKKALQFAVCYNLVITKDEYIELSDILDKIGGNA